jgi:hypothetical protein
LKKTALILALASTLFSCERVTEKTKDTLNKGGEVVGKTATEFFEGVSEGVDKTLQCDLTVSPDLQSKGIRTGKFEIGNDSAGGKNNRLSLYVIFDKNFKQTVSVMAFDKNGLEIGRSKQLIQGKAGDAKYYDFTFDKRTYIEVKSKIVLQ